MTKFKTVSSLSPSNSQRSETTTTATNSSCALIDLSSHFYSSNGDSLEFEFDSGPSGLQTYEAYESPSPPRGSSNKSKTRMEELFAAAFGDESSIAESDRSDSENSSTTTADVTIRSDNQLSNKVNLQSTPIRRFLETTPRKLVAAVAPMRKKERVLVPFRRILSSKLGNLPERSEKVKKSTTETKLYQRVLRDYFKEKKKKKHYKKKVEELKSKLETRQSVEFEENNDNAELNTERFKNNPSTILAKTLTCTLFNEIEAQLFPDTNSTQTSFMVDLTSKNKECGCLCFCNEDEGFKIQSVQSQSQGVLSNHVLNSSQVESSQNLTQSTLSNSLQSLSQLQLSNQLQSSRLSQSAISNLIQSSSQSESSSQLQEASERSLSSSNYLQNSNQTQDLSQLSLSRYDIYLESSSQVEEPSQRSRTSSNYLQNSSQTQDSSQLSLSRYDIYLQSSSQMQEDSSQRSLSNSNYVQTSSQRLSFGW